MIKTKLRTGARKGVPKPLKRTLDREFPVRFQKAIDDAGITITELADAGHCSRQVIHKYLSGGTKVIDSFLLFAVARTLNVSPDWLLFGGPVSAPKESLTGDQRLALNTLALLTTEEARSSWIAEGLKLHRQLGPPHKK